MNNYTYYSYEEYGRGYIGSRGCECSVEEDVEYFGSFSDKTFKPTQKIILETFETREDAYEAELLLHNFFEVDINSHFANKSKLTSSGFTCPKKFSDEEIQKRLKKQRTNAARKWKKNNPEKHKEQRKKSTEKNSDSIKLYQKNWNEQNKEKRKEYNKLYKEKNKELLKQKSKDKWKNRENKEKTKEYAKLYYEKNKELLKQRSKDQWKNRENKEEYSKNCYKKYKEKYHLAKLNIKAFL